MTTKLLAVDDSKTLRKVLEITFAGKDFQTELAASAEEALQKLRTHRPAVAVVDTALSGSSGYDLCQQLKNEFPALLVVLLSSKHRPYDQARGGQVGADDYIDKPFDTQTLIDKVKALLGRGVAPARAAAPAPVPRPAATTAPRPTVSAAVPQRPAVSVSAAARPAPAPTMGARPVAPAPTFGSTAARPTAASAAPAVAAPAPAPVAAPTAPAAAQPKVAAAVAAAASADLGVRLEGLGLDPSQVQSVLALSREVVERVVWEVVPVLAETLIKEEIARLTAE